MKDFIKVLLYIWQLPQNLLGLLLFRWYGHDDAIRGEHRRAKVLYSQKMRGGISLGKRIILPLKYAGLSNSYVRLALDHEWDIQGSRFISDGCICLSLVFRQLLGLSCILHSSALTPSAITRFSRSGGLTGSEA